MKRTAASTILLTALPGTCMMPCRRPSFIGFTGTPIELNDRSTPAVFGNYIDTYDILRAVEDETTVPIYYESRLARIELKEEEKPTLDPEFEEITEGEEMDDKQKAESQMGRAGSHGRRGKTHQPGG